MSFWPILKKILYIIAGSDRLFYTETEIRITYMEKKEVSQMFKPKFRFTYDEVRIIVMALVEFKNQLLAEGRYTDAIDDLLIKFVD